jgi:hypothetical protein
MRYEYHNFASNLKNIKNSKDMAITRELVVSEIAKVIDGRPFLVKKALIDCGIPLSNKPDKVELTKVLFFNLAGSTCLRNALGELVTNNQYPIAMSRKKAQRRGNSPMDIDANRDEFMNAGGEATGQIIAGITSLIGTGAGIWSSNKGFKSASEQRAHEMQLAQMNSDLALQQMNLMSSQGGGAPLQEAGMGSGSSMLVWILVGVGVVGIIGYAVYSSRKNVATTQLS